MSDGLFCFIQKHCQWVQWELVFILPNAACFIQKHTASGCLKSSYCAYRHRLIHDKTLNYTWVIQSRDAKFCVSQASMCNEVRWINACRCRASSVSQTSMRNEVRWVNACRCRASCVSHTSMRNEARWIYTCRCRAFCSWDARFCVSTGLTPSLFNVKEAWLTIGWQAFVVIVATVWYMKITRNICGWSKVETQNFASHKQLCAMKRG